MTDVIQRKIRFKPLENGNIGSIINVHGHGKVMVFPGNGFNPIPGNSYQCTIKIAMYGQYVDSFTNQSYRIGHAECIVDSEFQEADTLDILVYERNQETGKTLITEAIESAQSPFAAAFKKAKENKKKTRSKKKKKK